MLELSRAGWWKEFDTLTPAGSVLQQIIGAHLRRGMFPPVSSLVQLKQLKELVGDGLSVDGKRYAVEVRIPDPETKLFPGRYVLVASEEHDSMMLLSLKEAEKKIAQ